MRPTTAFQLRSIALSSTTAFCLVCPTGRERALQVMDHKPVHGSSWMKRSIWNVHNIIIGVIWLDTFMVHLFFTCKHWSQKMECVSIICEIRLPDVWQTRLRFLLFCPWNEWICRFASNLCFPWIPSNYRRLFFVLNGIDYWYRLLSSDSIIYLFVLRAYPYRWPEENLSKRPLSKSRVERYHLPVLPTALMIADADGVFLLGSVPKGCCTDVRVISWTQIALCTTRNDRCINRRRCRNYLQRTRSRCRLHCCRQQKSYDIKLFYFRLDIFYLTSSNAYQSLRTLYLF